MLTKLQSLTWPEVALIAVLLAAIIVAHMLAPGAVSGVTSVVSMLTGSLFVGGRPTSPAMTPGDRSQIRVVPPTPPSGGNS